MEGIVVVCLCRREHCSVVGRLISWGIAKANGLQLNEHDSRIFLQG